MVDVDIHVSNYLKEELAWAVAKQLRAINTIMLFKSSNTIKELNGTSHFKFKNILYVAMWPCSTPVLVLTVLCCSTPESAYVIIS